MAAGLPYIFSLHLTLRSTLMPTHLNFCAFQNNRQCVYLYFAHMTRSRDLKRRCKICSINALDACHFRYLFMNNNIQSLYGIFRLQVPWRIWSNFAMNWRPNFTWTNIVHTEPFNWGHLGLKTPLISEPIVYTHSMGIPFRNFLEFFF